ncbi:alpha/beta hydrolase fold domain-containing protein [Streptomyces sp. NPDC058394]|uniref:alpha/beta hydrolase fold domain-containing protein n=1 Tax=Streptomyces sp. NPDC058394 TaxID=3346477 RepID=UPI0036683077
MPSSLGPPGHCPRPRPRGADHAADRSPLERPPSRHELGNGYFLTTDLLADRVDPRAAPDPSGLRAATVITGSLDLLRDEGERYAEALRAP